MPNTRVVALLGLLACPAAAATVRELPRASFCPVGNDAVISKRFGFALH